MFLRLFPLGMAAVSSCDAVQVIRAGTLSLSGKRSLITCAGVNDPSDLTDTSSNTPTQPRRSFKAKWKQRSLHLFFSYDYLFSHVNYTSIH